ncbi:DHA2 family efflux MFS transporter permease subunit [Micromonospora rifamycinica]|uniref:DHA2 family efflux MFS transporter permease subunit n=1 Tax=Micromonospora rifamycinica TaxID=291594 RepID=UPI0034155440
MTITAQSPAVREPETGPADAPVTTEQPPEPTTPSSGAIVAMVVSIAGAFLALLDTTIVNVSLHDTQASFGGLDRVQWVLTAYLLALAATMPVTAWLADRFGPKRVFLAAVGLFLVGSAACAASPTLISLIAARGVAGAAAGVLTPISTVLLTRGVPREQLAKVQMLNGSVMLIGPLLGPSVGGLLVQAWGWPAVYAINIPICLAILIVTARRVTPDDLAADRPRRRLDVLGLLLGATGTVSAVMAIHGFADGGSWSSRVVWLPAGIAVAGLGLFVLRQLRTPSPLLDLRLFRHGVYATAALNIFFLGFVLYGPMVIIPLYFQAARGETAFVTGLLLSTSGIGVVVAGFLCRKLLRRLGGGRTMLIGISLTLLATLPLIRLTADTSYLLLCASLAVRGVGTGLTVVPAMTRAYESIPARSIADASPQLNLLQRLGGTAAAALVTVVLQRQAVQQHGLVPAAFAHACVWLLATSAVTMLPAVGLLVAERRETRRNVAG